MGNWRQGNPPTPPLPLYPRWFVCPKNISRPPGAVLLSTCGGPRAGGRPRSGQGPQLLPPRQRALRQARSSGPRAEMGCSDGGPSQISRPEFMDLNNLLGRPFWVGNKLFVTGKPTHEVRNTRAFRWFSFEAYIHLHIYIYGWKWSDL